MDEKDLFLDRWRKSRTRFFALIGSLASVDRQFRPSSEYRNISEQIAHVIAAQRTILAGLEDGAFAWRENKALAARMSIDELLDLAHNLDATLDQLLMHRDHSWLDEDSGSVALTRREWLWLMLEHEIHHAGQLSMSIRLGGGTPARIFE
jgi:uncharacterized damage-inducible protein DinB